jgi:hypothetical protein
MALFLLFFLVSARALHAEPAHFRPAVTKSPPSVSAICQLCDTPDCALLTCSTPLPSSHQSSPILLYDQAVSPAWSECSPQCIRPPPLV